MLVQMRTGVSRQIGIRLSASSMAKPSNTGIIRSSTMAPGRCKSTSSSACRASVKHTLLMPIERSDSAMRSSAIGSLDEATIAASRLASSSARSRRDVSRSTIARPRTVPSRAYVSAARTSSGVRTPTREIEATSKRAFTVTPLLMMKSTGLLATISAGRSSRANTS